uniref:Uncharacterized protein n=1 Tax=Lepeophtheirus salmonis TaxID=72036 RepID=A0A0K2UKH5_LEPSM
MGITWSKVGLLHESSFIQILINLVMCSDIPRLKDILSPSREIFMPISIGLYSAKGISLVKSSQSKIE